MQMDSSIPNKTTKKLLPSVGSYIEMYHQGVCRSRSLRLQTFLGFGLNGQHVIDVIVGEEWESLDGVVESDFVHLDSLVSKWKFYEGLSDHCGCVVLVVDNTLMYGAHTSCCFIWFLLRYYEFL
jgi:hypothetical protein